MSRRASLLLLLATFALSSALAAHVRLVNSGNGKALFWPDPAHVSVAIAALGSDDLPDASHVAAIQGSIASWNASTGTTARLVEDRSAAARARTDWQANDVHLVLFDETGASGYFPAGSGTVAITPVWFTSGGRIVDADVLFNGRGFSFTTSGQSGAFDVADVATHELGHLFGLDHSGAVGSSLYPYVSPGATVHRSIASDDEHGLRDAYPSGGAGSIAGTVRRASDGSPVAGAYVVARSGAGRTLASALASDAGTFRLSGLADDDYILVATPLDFPVSSANLTPGRTIQTDFRSTTCGPFAVFGAANVAAGELLVLPDARFSLGRNYDPLPLAAVRGRTSVLALHGQDLVPGSTLAAGDPSVAIAPVAWTGTQVVFRATVPAGAAPGHVDLIATSPAGELAVLPAALEILPAPPVIAGIQPAVASAAGGERVTITGQNFRAGLFVVLGGCVYEDGAPGGASVLDPNTLVLSTAPTAGGVVDVVLIDTTGVEGRLADGFTFATVPAIDAVFPLAGTASGGTSVTLSGSGFAAGTTVTIDGVAQPNAVVESATRLRLATEPGVPGGPYVVEVTAPGGALATAAFSYVAAPDPAPLALAPSTAPTSGAVFRTLTGSGFTPATEVTFGVDPSTGQGGTQASAVMFVDAGTLSVLVPAHTGGTVAVMASDASTGQAQVLEAAFTYQGSGGGGGACASLSPLPAGSRVGASVGARAALENGIWFLAALAGAWCAARRRPASRLAN